MSLQRQSNPQSGRESSWGFLRDFSLVWSYTRWRFGVLVLLGILEALLEGVGILLFIPLMEVSGFTAGEERAGGFASSFVVRTLNSATEGLGFGGVLLLIATAFSLKGVILFASWFYRSLALQNLGFQLRREMLHLVRDADYRTLVGQGSRIAHELAADLNRALQALMIYMMSTNFLLKVVLLAVAAFLLSPQVGLFFVTLALCSMWVVRRVLRKIREASRESSKRQADYSTRVAEAIRAVKYLRATGRFEAMEDKVTQDAHASLQVGRRLAFSAALQKGLQEPLVVVTMCGVLYMAHRVFALELAVLGASSLFLYRCIMELDRFQMNRQRFAQHRGSLDVLEERRETLLEAQRPVRGRIALGDGAYQAIFGSQPPSLQLSGISYQYEEAAVEGLGEEDGVVGDGVAASNAVLDDLHWKIEGGTFVAMVGESGAGKTTLLDLLSGILPPAAGTIAVNGVTVTDDNLGELRSGIGYVTQAPFLFDGTVLENLLLGTPRAGTEDAVAAAKAAHCHRFIEALPMGYETRVGDGGQLLSGGQTQLLGIARELVRKPLILLLDEPTSALDAESEDRIQQTLEELRGQVTLIVVSHRLATVRRADQIAFLSSGRVEEQGDFEELRGREDSRFRRFCELQGVL